MHNTPIGKKPTLHICSNKRGSKKTSENNSDDCLMYGSNDFFSEEFLIGQAGLYVDESAAQILFAIACRKEEIPLHQRKKLQALYHTGVATKKLRRLLS